MEAIPRAVAFLSAALNYRLKGEMSDDWAILIPADGQGIQLSLSKVSSPKARRHHIDLFTNNQKAKVERLLALEATKKGMALSHWRGLGGIAGY